MFVFDSVSFVLSVGLNCWEADELRLYKDFFCPPTSPSVHPLPPNTHTHTHWRLLRGIKGKVLLVLPWGHHQFVTDNLQLHHLAKTIRRSLFFWNTISKPQMTHPIHSLPMRAQRWLHKDTAVWVIHNLGSFQEHLCCKRAWQHPF